MNTNSDSYNNEDKMLKINLEIEEEGRKLLKLDLECIKGDFQIIADMIMNKLNKYAYSKSNHLWINRDGRLQGCTLLFLFLPKIHILLNYFVYIAI